MNEWILEEEEGSVPRIPPTIPASRIKKLSNVIVLSRIVRCIGSMSYLKKIPIPFQNKVGISI